MCLYLACLCRQFGLYHPAQAPCVMDYSDRGREKLKIIVQPN